MVVGLVVLVAVDHRRGAHAEIWMRYFASSAERKDTTPIIVGTAMYPAIEGGKKEESLVVAMIKDD